MLHTPMHFEVAVDGIPELERDFRRCELTLADAAFRAVDKGTREGIEEATARHRYKDRTGALTSTSFPRIDSSSSYGTWGSMVWPARYASYVEHGTRPHLIVGNPWLVFVWKGKLCRFRYVNHPGTKPYGFGGDAYLKCERVIYRELELGVFRSQEILTAAAA